MDLKELNYRKYSDDRRHPWELARLEVVFSLMENSLGTRLNENISVLDIGCGDLFFAENLALKLPNAKIIAVDTAFTAEELDHYSSKYKNTNIHVFDKLDNASVSLSSPADVVLLLDVVEHIEKDVEFLKWVKSHPFIGIKTIFFITVPAYQMLFFGHDIFLNHYRRYNNKSICETVNRAGYSIISNGYFFFSLLLIRIFEVLFEKLNISKKEEKTGLTVWNGGKFKSVFIKNILILDFKLFWRLNQFIKIKTPGLSNYVICQVSA